MSYYRNISYNTRTRLGPRSTRPAGRSGCIRYLMAFAVAAIAIISYLGSKTYNPVTGEEQYINITREQEIALGVQAAPEMAAQYGGLEPDPQVQGIVNQIGDNIVDNSAAAQSEYPFQFYALADNQTVNAFALPGGQVFITDALLALLENQDQLAGVLGHEIGHVIARHAAEQIAKQQLTEGLTGAVVLATYDPNDPSTQRTAQVALLIGQLINLKYGREDELEADHLGVCLMAQAGYDPNQMINVMQILDAASQGMRPPEFLSTHPDPGNRVGEIQNSIQNLESCPQ